MFTKPLPLFLLVFLVFLVSCGTNQFSLTQYYVDEETISRLMKNQATEGPNCVSAALMGRGALSTPFNVLPSEANERIFSQCFSRVDSIQDGDIVALHADDVIFHVFLKVGIDPGVFSKPNSSDPYELTSIAKMGNCLTEQGEVKRHCSSYRLKLSSLCPTTAYEAYLRKQSKHSIAARSSLYLKNVFGLTSAEKPPIQKSEVADALEALQHHSLIVDIDGNVSDTGIDITFLHIEMLNNTRSWLNHEP